MTDVPALGDALAGAAHSSPGIVFDHWGWRYAGRRRWAVHDFTANIAPGERILLRGPSGAGKSTILRAVAGLLGGADEGEETGRLTIDGAAPAASRGQTALVMQDPEAQIILARVGDDVAFGAENMCVPRPEIWQRVESSLDDVGLAVALDHSTAELSGGQQQRLVIAGALTMGAQWLLLDEPTANLDTLGVQMVCAAIENVVADRQRGLIIIEHRRAIWDNLIDRVIELMPDKPNTAVWAGGRGFATQNFGPAPDPAVKIGRPILVADDLTIGYSKAPVREHLRLSIPRGVSTIITGPNGCGKTTLALTLAGLLPRLGGQVRVADDLAARGSTDPMTWKSRELLTRIGTVFQSPEHQFVSSTVAEEIAVGLKALKRSKDDIDDTVAALLETLHLENLAKANPFTLSGGEKRRLSVGTVLATNPALIVLDEPTFGQDPGTWGDLVQLIGELRDQGTTILSVTHDEDYLAALGDNIIDLGNLVAP